MGSVSLCCAVVILASTLPTYMIPGLPIELGLLNDEDDDDLQLPAVLATILLGIEEA